MKLYVIRHGQTNCNKENKYNCRYDEDINEIGIKQAKEASKEIKRLDIDLIICSPLKRARHTADLINVNHIPVIFDDRLIEREGGVLTNTIIEEDYYLNEYYNYNSTNIVEGLESLPQLFKRVHAFIDEIKEKYAGKNILLVTHNGIARTIYFYFESLPEDGNLLGKSGHRNCEVKVYEL